MKKQIVKAMVVVAVLFCAASALAQDSWTYSLRAQVPFQFVVRGATMPAGEYTLRFRSTIPGPMMLEQSGGKTALVSQAQSDDKWSGSSELVFEQIGGTYYLIEVHDTRTGVHQVQQGKLYLVARKAAPPQTSVIAAK